MFSRTFKICLRWDGVRMEEVYRKQKRWHELFGPNGKFYRIQCNNILVPLNLFFTLSKASLFFFNGATRTAHSTPNAAEPRLQHDFLTLLHNVPTSEGKHTIRFLYHSRFVLIQGLWNWSPRSLCTSMRLRVLKLIAYFDPLPKCNTSNVLRLNQIAYSLLHL